MVKLPIVSSDEVISVLRKNGFDFAPKRGKGSHLAFYKVDEKRIKRCSNSSKKETDTEMNINFYFASSK